jgi:hypothetical protein
MPIRRVHNHAFWTFGVMLFSAILGVLCGVFTIEEYNTFEFAQWVVLALMGGIVGSIVAKWLPANP